MSQLRSRGGEQNRPRNHFLANLPPDVFQRIASKLVPVELPQGMRLSEANEPIASLYFPEFGLISTNATTPAGESIEVGMSGREGFSGLPALLGQPEMQHEVVVQCAGHGHRLRSSIMVEELNANPAVRVLVDNFIYVQMVASTQSVLCARLHGLQQRLARWLLTAGDRMESDQLQLTQEYMARMLGSRRSTVTVTAQALQEAGAIEYRRGRIMLTSRPKLESMACGCYRIVQASYDRLLPQDAVSKV
ncbi:MAG: Crp/Fnr family transcriptional regulator [Acidobacteriota bacterium]